MVDRDVPDGFNKVHEGYSSGAMAGLGIAMILVGGALGYVVMVYVLKW